MTGCADPEHRLFLKSYILLFKICISSEVKTISISRMKMTTVLLLDNLMEFNLVKRTSQI